MEGRVSHFLDNLQKDGSYTHCMCPCAHCMCLYAIWEQRFRTDAQGTVTHKLMRLPVSAAVSILRPSFQKQRHLSVLRLAFHCGFQWPVLSSSGFTVQTVSPLCPNPRLDNLQKRNSPRYNLWSFCCLAVIHKPTEHPQIPIPASHGMKARWLWRVPKLAINVIWTADY